MSMSLSLDALGSTHPVRQREWGGRRSNGHHRLYDPPHDALHVLASVNNGAPITGGNWVTPAQVWPTLSPSKCDYFAKRHIFLEPKS
jgi:hypothetical protein